MTSPSRSIAECGYSSSGMTEGIDDADGPAARARLHERVRFRSRRYEGVALARDDDEAGFEVRLIVEQVACVLLPEGRVLVGVGDDCIHACGIQRLAQAGLPQRELLVGYAGTVGHAVLRYASSRGSRATARIGDPDPSWIFSGAATKKKR